MTLRKESKFERRQSWSVIGMISWMAIAQGGGCGSDDVTVNAGADNPTSQAGDPGNGGEEGLGGNAGVQGPVDQGMAGRRPQMRQQGEAVLFRPLQGPLWFLQVLYRLRFNRTAVL